MKKITILGSLALSVVLTGCGGSDGPTGVSALVSLSDEGAGDNCEWGGQKIDYGADGDGSATLDEAEISH